MIVRGLGKKNPPSGVKRSKCTSDPIGLNFGNDSDSGRVEAGPTDSSKAGSEWQTFF